jgi:pimeloyl-ACP methyl ester carboxylesterase
MENTDACCAQNVPPRTTQFD